MINLQVQAFSPKALKPKWISAGLLTYSLSSGPSRRLEADSGIRTIRLRNIARRLQHREMFRNCTGFPFNPNS